jgi:double-stranded uracil-DNA glycosylase
VKPCNAKAFSFPPISAAMPRALILGSMPGVRSLEKSQYYAHPRNSFWQIMAGLFGTPAGTYPQRVALIKKHRLALWDVLKCCERHGSLDSNIREAEANDLVQFLKARPAITHIFFNGATAEREFRRRVLPQLPDRLACRLTLTGLPSTSPAMASLTADQKLQRWKIILTPLSLPQPAE